MPNPRNRLVVFRLTQDEYDNLKAACTEKGERSLSEFTRSELLASPQTRSLGGQIDQRFSRLEKLLSDIQKSLRRLADPSAVSRSNAAQD